MPAITRRTFGGLAAAALTLRQARAQAELAQATRNLPRTYAGKTLRITWGSTPSYDQLIAFSQRFTEATGIALEFAKLQQADRYQKAILDASTNTNAFDIYITAYQWKDQLAPYAADLTHIDQEVKGAPPMDWDDYPARALQAYSRLGDKSVTVPLLGDASLLVWDKKLLAAAGVDAETAPADWEAVYQRGQKVTGGGHYGFNMPAGKSIQTACIWLTLFHGFGGQYFDASGKAQFGSEASVRTLRFMAERLGKISPPGNLTWDFPEMLNSMATGQSAQGYMWTGGFSTLFDPQRSTASGSLGWSPTPQAVLLGGWGLAVNAHSRSLDAAKLFVGWLTSKEISRATALVSGTPCRTSAFEDPEVVKRFPSLPAVQKGMEGPVAVYPPIKESEQINIMIYDQANAACAGTKTPEHAAADLQDNVVSFLKRRGYDKG